MKKLFALLLAGMMSLSLAACGGSKEAAPAGDHNIHQNLIFSSM